MKFFQTREGQYIPAALKLFQANARSAITTQDSFHSPWLKSVLQKFTSIVFSPQSHFTMGLDKTSAFIKQRVFDIHFSQQIILDTLRCLPLVPGVAHPS